jgi:hypothetical protein
MYFSYRLLHGELTIVRQGQRCYQRFFLFLFSERLYVLRVTMHRLVLSNSSRHNLKKKMYDDIRRMFVQYDV